MNANLGSIRRLIEIKEAKAYLIVVSLQSLAQGWFFSTYVLFLLSKGLNLFQANLLNVGFMAVSFLLDAPMGKLADQIGQKRVYVWGQFFWALGMLIYGLGNVFTVFLLAECTGAIGSAMISQALESWLRNVVKEDISHEAISTASALGYLASVPSALLGGLIGSILGLNWPWFLSALSCCIAGLISCRVLGELKDCEKKQSEDRNRRSLIDVAMLTWKTGPLRLSAIVAFVVGASIAPVNMFWAPILKDLSGSAWWLGFMWIGVALSSSVGSVWARKQVNSTGLVRTILIIGCPLLFTAAFPTTLPVTAFFVLHEVGRGAIRPILFTYSNRHIPNEIRSTANSVRSSSWTFGNGFGLFVSGLLTSILSPLQIWSISAIALVILALYVKKKG